MRSEQTRDTSRKILPQIIIFALKLVVISGCYGNFALPFFNQFFLVSHSLQQITENIAKIMLNDVLRHTDKSFLIVCCWFFRMMEEQRALALLRMPQNFFPLCSKKRESFLTRRNFCPRRERKLCGFCAFAKFNESLKPSDSGIKLNIKNIQLHETLKFPRFFPYSTLIKLN